MGLFYCLFYGFTKSIMDTSNYDVIGLQLPCINIVDFDISDTTKQGLYSIGYDAATQFYDHQDPPASDVLLGVCPDVHQQVESILKSIIEAVVNTEAVTL